MILLFQGLLHQIIYTSNALADQRIIVNIFSMMIDGLNNSLCPKQYDLVDLCTRTAAFSVMTMDVLLKAEIILTI